MVAVIEVCKAAMSFLPNIELTTFWLIMFTLFWGRKVALVVPVFILLEGCVYGFGSWWFMYLYIWPLLVLGTWLFRKEDSVWFWSIYSALFGLLFGLLGCIPYIIMGAWDGGILNGLYAGVTWWVAGIWFDILHSIGNFVLMMTLYTPIKGVMKKLPNQSSSA
ncbi:MAG: hypothetical protein IJF07_05915 [Lachnospiraceae bacterium]|nr:hypothetical protein [Lachnospiraceae bacterium]